jgi:hypothetical protein
MAAFPPIFLRMRRPQVRHNAAIIRVKSPASGTGRGEFAVVIGQRGRRISRAVAWKRRAVYSIHDDVGLRDWQRHATPDDRREATKLKLQTRTSGATMQSPDTSILISDRAAHQCCSTILERTQAT